MGGISNFQIEEAFKKIGDEDLLKNFVGVFPSNRMNRFIDHAAMISDCSGKYPFVIVNTDAEGKPGVHWRSILDIEPRNDFFFFQFFRSRRTKTVHNSRREKNSKKILLGIEKMDKTDNKITLCRIKFNMGEYKKLSKEETDSLSETARNFFCFINAFGIKLKLRSFVNVWMVEDRVQNLESATCGIFQIYFYENLFNPEENSSIQNETKLKKSTVEKLLNELFSLEDVDNENKMEEYADEIGVKFIRSIFNLITVT